MGINFPNAPTTGQLYPQPAVAGVPVYRWDGTVWTTVGGAIGGKTAVYTDGTTPMTAQLQLVDPPVGGLSATSKNYVDASDAGMIKYTAQALTEPQRVQTRQNIFAAPFDAEAYNGIQINGAFDVSQDKGFGVNVSSSGYFCDSWIILNSGAQVAPVQVAANIYYVGGIPNIAWITPSTPNASPAAGDYCVLSNNIEGYRMRRVSWGGGVAQPITLAFWSFHHRTGLYSIGVCNADGSRSYTTTYTHAVSDVGQYNVITIPGCPDGTWNSGTGYGMGVRFGVMGGSNWVAASINSWLSTNTYMAPGAVNGIAATTDAFRITGLVVLPGSEAPPASRSAYIIRPYDQELLLCKRYFYNGVPPLRGVVAGAVGSSGTALSRLSCWHPVPMRAIPVLTMTAALPIFDGNTTTTIASVGGNADCTTTVLEFDAVAAAVQLNGRPAMVYQGSGGNINVDARL
jgi:hypothetical protein